MEPWGENEDHEEVRNDEGEGENRTKTTLGFPILDIAQDVIMKKIPPSSLPTFYRKSNEDPDTFLFEFDILCRSYNYLQDGHKLNIFLATLKESALRWFMGLGELVLGLGKCCNLIDHIRLPIIHTKTYIHNKDKR